MDIRSGPDKSQAALLDAVYACAPVGIAHHDLQLRYLGINERLASMNGLSVAEHLGKRVDEVLPAALAALHQANLHQVIDTGRPVLDVALRVESPQHDLALRDWKADYFPLHDASGEVSGVASVVQDVTEWRDHERRLQTERRVAQVLVEADDLDAALPAALDAIMQSFDMRFCEFWMPKEDGKLVRRILRTGDLPANQSAELEAIPLAFGEGLIGKVMATREPVWIPDVKTDPEFRRVESASLLGLCTGFAFPINVNDACLGVMSFFSMHRLDIGPALAGVLTRLGQEIGRFAARAEMKRTALENEARTHVVIESALDAVISIAENGRVLEWNPRAEEMFGWSRDQAIGSDLACLIIPPESREAHYAGMKKFLKTGEGAVLNKRIEVTALRRDNTQFPVELAILPLKLGDRYEFSAYLRDITDQKRVEAELIDADRRKTEFLAILGHELRNPLATIANCVRLIEGKPDSAVEMAAMMGPQIDQLKFLLDDLLDITRITYGKVALNKRIVALETALGGAVDTTRSIIQERKQHLHTELHAVEGREIYADATRIQQIVGNLLTNASKYSPVGSTIWLRTAVDGDEYVITVEDEGIGIPPDRIDDIFDAFTQIRESPTGAGGLGIGLTLVRMLTELHGGSVHVSSGGTRKGSVFEVRLPARVPENTSRYQPRPKHVEKRPDLHVLIVDDNDVAAITLGQLLERSIGCQTEVVFDGVTALAAARARVPDVMLVDIKLPDMSGLEIAGALRADPRFTGTRLIALSGFGHQDAIDDSLDAGFEQHLAKPVDLAELLSALSAS